MALPAFALLLTLAAIGALLRGGVVERRGVVLFIGAWVASLTAQWISGETSPGLWLPVIDATVLGWLVALSWRSPRPWPIYATGFQMLTLAGDLAPWIRPDIHLWRHMTLLATLSFGAVGVLTLGAWFPPRRA